MSRNGDVPKEVLKRRKVQSLGELLGLARCRNHQHRYCDQISSLRRLGGGSDGSDSVTWEWFKMRHELDHQLYLVLAAMAFRVRTALRISGGAVSWVM